MYIKILLIFVLHINFNLYINRYWYDKINILLVNSYLLFINDVIEGWVLVYKRRKVVCFVDYGNWLWWIWGDDEKIKRILDNSMGFCWNC
jgi:hypothetical protein